MWERLYLDNRRALTVYAASLAGNLADGMDLLQDVFVRLIGARAAPVNPLAFALRCLRNLAIDRRRARSSACDGDLAISLAFLAAPPPRETTGYEQGLREALAAISDGQREVIVLKIFGELTFAAIAEVLVRPIGTVTSLYARGIDALRTQLGTETDNEYGRNRAKTAAIADRDARSGA